MKSVAAIFDRFQEMHILVIGDVMLDTYVYGHIERMSPEAPVPVVDVQSEETRLGGAANVALNCKALGAEVSIATVIGNDQDGMLLKKLLNDAAISTKLVMQSDNRITTNKQRVIARNQQMIRIDREIQSNLSIQDEHPFIDQTLRFIQVQKPSIVIIEDYDKGIMTAHVIDKIIAHCNLLNVPIAVDPKKKHFLNYKNVTLFKPNLKEIKEGLKIPDIKVCFSSLLTVHQKLKDILQHKISLFTLSEHGVFVADENYQQEFPSFRRTIADVSGAGDTVIAVASMTYIATNDTKIMAQWANLAGGLVCEVVGVVPIDADKLRTEIEKLSLLPHS